MGTPAPKDNTATLKEAEYCDMAENALHDLVKLIEDRQSWTLTDYGDEEFVILSRKSDVKGAKESILMLETELDLSPPRVEILLAQWKEYRLHWDDMLEDATIIASYPNDIYLIRHIIKKRISLSARESIDVVKLISTDDLVIFASCGTSHDAYPPSKAYVRTHQYIGGYAIERLPNERSRLAMIFHADLNLPKPQIISILADRFKPRLMMENVRSLQDAIEKYRPALL